MKDKKNIIVYTFQSLEDPLVKGLILQYLLNLSQQNKYGFHLITHEQSDFHLSKEELEMKKAELKEKNIYWYPLKYHNGRFLILKKIFDFLKSAAICFKIKWKYKAGIIIGFLPIAAGYSAILAPILRLKLITYCFEPHSEYMSDFGIWKRNGLKFNLLRKYERIQLELASFVVVPTSHTKLLVEKLYPAKKTRVLPISIDTDKNIFDTHARMELRKKYGIGEKFAFLYMGKFNGIYYDIPTVIDYFYGFHQLNQYHFIIISDAYAEIMKYLDSSKYDRTFFTVLEFIPYEKLNSYISMADMGVVAVPPLPSQIYRTPVKTGLYLSCGIPYLVNKGIAEDDLLAEKYEIGVVTDNFNIENIDEMHSKISKLRQDSEELSKRCRQIAVQERSHSNATKLLDELLSEF